MQRLHWVGCVSVALLLLGGCSDDETKGGSGGSSGNSGSAGSANGGSSGNGGSAGNGGSSASGGSAGASSGGSAGATGGSAGATTGGAAGASTGGSAGASTGGSAGATGGTGGSGGSTCAGTELTVKNVLSWCSVSVAGGAASSAAEQTVCIENPGEVDLVATALSGFILGTAPWHNTDQDQGSGEQGTLSGSGQSQTSTASVTIHASDSTDCVWVCCPFPDGTGCPTTDQCP